MYMYIHVLYTVHVHVHVHVICTSTCTCRCKVHVGKLSTYWDFWRHAFSTTFLSRFVDGDTLGCLRIGLSTNRDVGESGYLRLGLSANRHAILPPVHPASLRTHSRPFTPPACAPTPARSPRQAAHPLPPVADRFADSQSGRHLDSSPATNRHHICPDS